jgi:hypothetical protein
VADRLRRRGPALDRQGVGGGLRVTGHRPARRPHPVRLDLPSRVSAPLGRSILRDPDGALAALVRG